MTRVRSKKRNIIDVDFVIAFFLVILRLILLELIRGAGCCGIFSNEAVLLLDLWVLGDHATYYVK